MVITVPNDSPGSTLVFDPGSGIAHNDPRLEHRPFPLGDGDEIAIGIQKSYRRRVDVRVDGGAMKDAAKIGLAETLRREMRDC